jgi:hypothetical protein
VRRDSFGHAEHRCSKSGHDHSYYSDDHVSAVGLSLHLDSSRSFGVLSRCLVSCACGCVSHVTLMGRGAGTVRCCQIRILVARDKLLLVSIVISLSDKNDCGNHLIASQRS